MQVFRLARKLLKYYSFDPEIETVSFSHSGSIKINEHSMWGFINEATTS